MFEPSLSLREPFIHARSERHLAPPGLWLVLRIQRRTVDGPCPLGSHRGGGHRPTWGHRSPRVSSAVTSTGVHIPATLSPKQAPTPSPCPAVISFSAVATTRRTCHRVRLSCAFPTPDKLHENQDLVCVPPSPTPAPGTQ